MLWQKKLWLLFTADQLGLVDKTWRIGYKLFNLPVWWLFYYAEYG